MPNIPNPLSVAAESAENFENPMAKSLIFAAVAKAHFAAGHYDDAFAAVAIIPNRAEKKGTLLDLAADFAAVQPPLPTELLIRIIATLIEVDPKSSTSAGRFAQLLLENGNINAALALIEAVPNAFNSDKNREVFVTKLAETGSKAQLAVVKNMLKFFEDADYRDRAQLALCKGLARTERWNEAEEVADSFASVLRRSRAFWELAHLATKERSETLLQKSCAILETFTPNKENAEHTAAQLRITGKAAFKAGLTQTGLQLLEQCEAAAALIPVPLQRLKAEYLLAKVLRELGQVSKVADYLDTDKAENADWTGIQRSEVLQWFAEASGSGESVVNIWNRAVQEAAKAQSKEVNEFPRAERIVELVRRFSAPLDAVPTDDPQVDAARLSAETFEEHYYSPFSIADCDCG